MFDLADIWATRTGSIVRLVSANDHMHRHGSAHYAGLALDLHSSDNDGLAAYFRRIGYTVLWRVPGHHTHLHVQEPRTPMSGDVVDEPRGPIGTAGVPVATAKTRATRQADAASVDFP